jgi:hypothetical protein
LTASLPAAPDGSGQRAIAVPTRRATAGSDLSDNRKNWLDWLGDEVSQWR